MQFNVWIEGDDYILKIAYSYKDILQKKFEEIMFKEYYKYYNNDCYYDYDCTPKDSSWNALQFVSIDKENNVVGYLSANINRSDNKISALEIVNFDHKCNITFAKDLHTFLLDLFEKFNFRKICWGVVVGNPIEKMYDKYCLKYGGSIVGTHKRHIKLYDGELYDYKLYEILKEDYFKIK